jgi:uncharacterized protein
MSAKMLTPQQVAAYRKLNIRTYPVPGGIAGDRVIICLDGGGIRGILTVQLLKQIEQIAGMPCHAFCDMVAGTSTGAIIAGLIADGKTAEEIEELYVGLVKGVFQKRSILSSQAIDPPMYSKENYRADLKDKMGNRSLLEVCAVTDTDILITTKDMTTNRELFFTCFNNNGWLGTYKDALLRVAMEATMSAPTYFRSLDRFIDGGTTVYNNPSLAALMQALEYDGKGKYESDKVTMFSLGTGRLSMCISVEQAAHPGGIDMLFWFNYIVKTAIQDANTLQSDLFRSRVFRDVDYRRFQVSLDAAAMRLLPDRDISALNMPGITSIHQLTDKDLNNINLDDVHKFGLMKEIGAAMVDYIMRANRFTRDLNDTPDGKDELVTVSDHSQEIAANVSQPQWIDVQPMK